MKDWKVIAEKRMEICILLDTHLKNKLKNQFWDERKQLYKELSLLESQEVEGEKQMADMDSILKYLSNNGIGTGTNITVRSCAGLIQSFIAQWVEPNAQQYSTVTDEDIEKYFSLEKSTSGFIASKEYNQMQQYKIEGALAMKYNLIKPE